HKVAGGGLRPLFYPAFLLFKLTIPPNDITFDPDLFAMWKAVSIYIITSITGMSVLLGQGPKLRFTHLSGEQGLSNSWIEAIFQDSRGFMWIGTRNGLDRYDGQQFKIYQSNKKDTTSISDNSIKYIYEDIDHNLWVGTANGLNRFDANKDCFIRYKHNPADIKTISNNIIS